MAKTLKIGENYYEVVKGSTAKGKALYNAWRDSVNYYGCRSLRACYERPSWAKECAYEDCMRMLNDFDYFEWDTVIGYNCMQFSYGAYVEYDNIAYVMYITKSHNYLVLF